MSSYMALKLGLDGAEKPAEFLVAAGARTPHMSAGGRLWPEGFCAKQPRHTLNNNNDDDVHFYSAWYH